MWVTDRQDMTLAIKVALYPSTIDQYTLRHFILSREHTNPVQSQYTRM